MPRRQSAGTVGRSEVAHFRAVSWRLARDGALVWLAVVFLSAGFRSVVSGISWTLPAVIVVTVVAVACLAVRALRWRGAELIVLAVWAWALCVVFAASTLRWGVVPTRATLEALGSHVAAAGRILASEAAPVAPVPGMALSLAVLCGLAVIIMDVFLHRWRSITVVGLVLAVLFVVPTVMAQVDPSQLVFIPAAVCWLLLLRADTQQRADGPVPWVSRLPVALIGGAALVFAATTPISPPSLQPLGHDWGAGAPDPFAAGVDPNIELGRNLRRNVPRTTLIYTTTLPEAPYLKIATLREFTGDTWRPVERDHGGRAPPDRAIPDRDVAATSHETLITIKKLCSHRLPVPYPATNVSGLDGEWAWQRTGLTLRSDEATTAGQRYRVNSSDVDPTLDQLRAGDVARGSTMWSRLRDETQLPEDTPSSISRAATKVTADADSNYDRAVALQDWLRSSGEFSYSEVAPVAEGYDGTGLDVIGQFLDERRGYCVHFASTMAVMARELGIPARLAVGFAPGAVVETDDDGEAVYEVTTDNMHAWPELYFAGVGWVRFDPTPTVGSPTSVTEEISPGDIDNQAQPQTDAPDDTSGAERAGQTPGGQADATAGAGWWWLWPMGVFMVIVLAGPALIRSVRRRLRIRGGQPVRMWREVVDTARDVGYRPAPGATPRQFAASLGRLPDTEQRTLDELVTAVEAARYGPDGYSGRLDDASCTALLQVLGNSASRGVRWRSRVIPPSVFSTA